MVPFFGGFSEYSRLEDTQLMNHSQAKSDPNRIRQNVIQIVILTVKITSGPSIG